jgi:pentatricopeptide repeat protein
MAHRSCERTPTTYTTLLRGAEAAGDWRFALDALDAMAESGLRPTPQAYTCAISACAAAGQLAAARDLTARLQAGGGGGGVAPAHLLILMHDRCCDWRAVRAVFDDLSASGVRPDGASFGALAAALWGCGSASSCLLALRVFEEACELGVFK